MVDKSTRVKGNRINPPLKSSAEKLSTEAYTQIIRPQLEKLLVSLSYKPSEIAVIISDFSNIISKNLYLSEHRTDIVDKGTQKFLHFLLTGENSENTVTAENLYNLTKTFQDSFIKKHGDNYLGEADGELGPKTLLSLIVQYFIRDGSSIDEQLLAKTVSNKCHMTLALNDIKSRTITEETSNPIFAQQIPNQIENDIASMDATLKEEPFKKYELDKLFALKINAIKLSSPSEIKNVITDFRKAILFFDNMDKSVKKYLKFKEVYLKYEELQVSEPNSPRVKNIAGILSENIEKIKEFNSYYKVSNEILKRENSVGQILEIISGKDISADNQKETCKEVCTEFLNAPIKPAEQPVLADSLIKKTAVIPVAEKLTVEDVPPRTSEEIPDKTKNDIASMEATFKGEAFKKYELDKLFTLKINAIKLSNPSEINNVITNFRKAILFFDNMDKSVEKYLKFKNVYLKYEELKKTEPNSQKVKDIAGILSENIEKIKEFNSYYKVSNEILKRENSVDQILEIILGKDISSDNQKEACKEVCTLFLNSPIKPADQPVLAQKSIKTSPLNRVDEVQTVQALQAKVSSAEEEQSSIRKDSQGNWYVYDEKTGGMYALNKPEDGRERVAVQTAKRQDPVKTEATSSMDVYLKKAADLGLSSERAEIDLQNKEKGLIGRDKDVMVFGKVLALYRSTRSDKGVVEYEYTNADIRTSFMDCLKSTVYSKKENKINWEKLKKIEEEGFLGIADIDKKKNLSIFHSLKDDKFSTWEKNLRIIYTAYDETLYYKLLSYESPGYLYAKALLLINSNKPIEGMKYFGLLLENIYNNETDINKADELVLKIINKFKEEVCNNNEDKFQTMLFSNLSAITPPFIAKRLLYSVYNQYINCQLSRIGLDTITPEIKKFMKKMLEYLKTELVKLEKYLVDNNMYSVLNSDKPLYDVVGIIYNTLYDKEFIGIGYYFNKILFENQLFFSMDSINVGGLKIQPNIVNYDELERKKYSNEKIMYWISVSNKLEKEIDSGKINTIVKDKFNQLFDETFVLI